MSFLSKVLFNTLAFSKSWIWVLNTYLYNATPRRTAKMPVANAKNNAMNT